MEVDVIDMKGKKLKTVELPSKIFEAPVNVSLMHQAYVRQITNARLGTHSTKSRSEVSGGGRKPWRQKGTGRARQGSIRSPQWVGGGKAHKPKPRDYKVSMPKKMRHAALRSALTTKARENSIMIMDSISLSEAKTSEMVKALDQLIGDASVLVVLPRDYEDYALIVRSIRNIPDAKTLMANYLNIRDLLSYDKVIMPLPAVDVIESYLG